MPDIYDLNTDQQILETLPPDKRYVVMVTWLQTLLKGTVQWLRDRLINDYRLGSSAPDYAAGTYQRNALVKYQRGVYSSLMDGNTEPPENESAWYKTQDNFIGLNERIMYNGQTLVLTYALNRWFGTTFRQPNAGISDIYLITNPQPVSPFIVGGRTVNSSIVFSNRSIELVVNQYTFSQVPNLTIMVPDSLYQTLGPNDTARTNIVRSFTDRYITAGLFYNVQTY